MKKLLVFHPALAPYRVDFFNALNDAFDASFYFSNDNVKDQNFDQQQLRSQCRFEFHLLDKGLEVGGRSFRTGISGLLKTHKPDIVICSEYSQITVLVLLLKIVYGLKFKIFTISDDSVDLSAKRRGARKVLRDKVSHYINGIIFPGVSVCNWYHKHVNSKTRLFSLPIVHENNAFRTKIEKVLPAAALKRYEYGLQDKKVFLFVGRLVKIKNAEFLIHAFGIGASKMPDAVLVIIGDGPERETLHKLVKELKLESTCIFLGRLEGDALHAWFQIAHYLVLPSYQEPYGAVVNEALLAGCWVLCSKLAGAAELIAPYNGAIFDPFEKNEFCDLMVAHYDRIKVNTQQDELRSDLMPFQLSDKLTSLISFLKH